MTRLEYSADVKSPNAHSIIALCTKSECPLCQSKENSEKETQEILQNTHVCLK